jgi:anti-anti-sigma regulatory factor
MDRPYRHISVDCDGDVFNVRLRSHRLDEPDILEMADELLDLINDKGCRKMLLSLGPGEVECLYSVFLAKLVMVRRILLEQGGRLVICEARPETVGVFEACHLKEFFEFVPDQAAALASLAK